MRRDDIPDRYPFKGTYLPDVEWLNPGESTIIDPDGKFLVEPVRNKEEILYAEVDPRNLKGPRFQLDVAGHYGRPDVFELTIRRNARPMVRVLDQRSSHDTRPISHDNDGESNLAARSPQGRFEDGATAGGDA